VIEVMRDMMMDEIDENPQSIQEVLKGQAFDIS